MSLRKYIIGIILGVTSGALIAITLAKLNPEAPRATRKIASEKWSKLPRGHVGKVAAPLFVQILNTPSSTPETGYYKLVAHISFNQAIGSIRYQWALPSEARLISGNLEGEIQLTNGEDEWEETVEIQVTDTQRDQNVMFDISFNQNGSPLGSSDIFVFRSQSF
jgi:hypothetical protein